MNRKKTAIIDVVDPHQKTESALQELVELKSLIKTYGGIDVAYHIQHRSHPDKNTFIGSGKAQELMQVVKEKQIEIVILNAIVKPTQLFNLTRGLWPVNPNIEVWDRVDLILHIFEKHAQTAEAKLQIEIARMKHMGPRISGLGGTVFSRQGGGVGGRGEGQTNTERMKLHWKTQIAKKEEELDRHRANRQKQMDRRAEQGLKQVALVGYTNAGKTTLFNELTGKKKVVQNALFVTLDSTIGKLHTTAKTTLISDSIGFIQNLPPTLINTFKSTLLDAIHAALILHVIDVTDPKREMKIDVVNQILHEIGAGAIPQVFVFTKADMMPTDRWGEFEELKKRYANRTPLFISSTENINLAKLVSQIEDRLK
jgi:GTP-binding protein HflX